MSAILGRMIAAKDGPLVTEYLSRNEALFADCEWVWTQDRDAAWRFEFSTHAEEVAAVERFSSVIDGREVRPWAINLPRSGQHPTSNIQHPTSKDNAAVDGERSVITERIARAKVQRARRKIAAPPVAEDAARDGGAPSEGAPRVAAPSAPSDGARRWREIYHARVSPAEAYANLERRHLD